MKRHFKLCAIALSIALLISSLSPLVTSAENNDMKVVFKNDSFTMYEDDYGYRFKGPVGNLEQGESEAAAVISTAKDYYKAHNTNSKDIAMTKSSKLPSSVDLSESKYFPPVGDQAGLGSCATFSSTYYQFSYAVNENRDVQATYENTRSPQIVYNFVNAGHDGIGTSYHGNYHFLQHFGAPTMKEVPYSDADYMNWHASEGIWREGIRARLKDYYEYENVGIDDKQITSPDDEDLIAFKTALNDGKVLGYSTFIYSWVSNTLKANPNAPENDKHIGEHSVVVCDGSSGSHAMAIVGYNDDIWTDINKNDKVDSGEMGAFKIVNSWGEGYCNKGFAWVAYDALNKVSCVEGANFSKRVPIFESVRSITVRDYNDLSDIYIQYTLNTASRAKHEVDFTLDKNGTETTWEMFYGCGGGYKNDINEGAFDGTNIASDGTFVCPIDNIVKDFKYEDFSAYNFNIEFKDTEKDSKPLIVKDVRIVNELTGQSYIVSDNLPCTLDGNSVSFNIKNTDLVNKVIYYVGFDNPTLNYKIGDGEFKSVKMEENFERIGSTHKYIIEDANDDVTLYFTDENGNIDDNSGKYYKALDRLNFYRTHSVHEELSIKSVAFGDSTPDVLQRFFFKPEIQGGYAPFNDQYTIENLDTGEIKYIYYHQLYEKSFVFYSAGNYRLTAEVTDQAGDVATFTMEFYFEDLPFEFETFDAEKDVMFVGESSKFNAVTKNESIIAYGPVRGKYLFEVKDENGELVYSESKISDKYNMLNRVSYISFEYIPEKAGNYTLTVSSTDQTKDEAKMTISYTVYDKIYGDSNSSGSVDIMDATNTQRYLASIITEDAIHSELADCDINTVIDIIDATLIQRYVAALDNTEQVGKIIEYIPPVKPTEPETKPTEPVTSPTEKPTDPPVTKNIVTFTNSFNWGGTIYCYYWSDSDTAMISWPGKAMTNAGINTFGETMYTFEVPQNANYIIFSNGSSQTTDITYSGGEVRYYPISETDSKGHNKVATW